jgi:putative cell wall-binding protein
VHTYESVTTDPTCTTEGKTTYTCTKCGDSYSETIAKLPHQWDEGTVTKEPTAAEAGEKTQHCATCDNVRITIIPALGKVLRVQGDNRYETAFQAANLVKAKLGAEKFNCIVVASGTNFADALPGSYLATMNQAPILLVNKHTVQDVADYIYENTYSGAYVYILGGEAAVPAELDALLENEFTVRRLAGANRYETNLLILEAAGVATEDVLVCTGRDFADSLSVSALGRPILLVNKSLTDSQKAWLGKLESNTLYVIGGKNAVSQSIEEELANYSYGYVERIEGSNRYETSLKVAETFFPVEADNVVLAYGHNFPDGLCGGVLAYNMNAPLILTRDNSLSFAAEFAAARAVATGAVLGGPGLIADSTVQQIFGTEPMLYE